VFAAYSSGTITLGNGAGDTVTIEQVSGSTITLGNGAGDTVTTVGAIGGSNKITLGNGNDDSVNVGDSFASGNTITVGNGDGDVVTDDATGNTITVGNGNDTVSAGDGSNITVGKGNDTVSVGNGSTITAGNGIDTFVIGASDVPTPSVLTGSISGFRVQDKIDLPGIAFGAQTTLAYAENSTNTGINLTAATARTRPIWRCRGPLLRPLLSQVTEIAAP
jgi:Ca2+-binding RTX toxin-like protein